MVSELDPLFLFICIHSISSFSCQSTFESIYNLAIPESADISKIRGEIVNTSFAACITFTVLIIPPAVIVIVPVLGILLEFSLYVILRIELTVSGNKIIHSASSSAVHSLFDVIVNSVLPSAFETNLSDGFIASDGVDSCVTVTVLLIPPPVMVSVPTLSVVLGFAVY